MSILINGMEMPKNCGSCRFAGVCGVHPVEEWPDLESIIFNDVIGVDGERDPDCPLVPVPPHGRLIEKNAVFELIRSFPNVDRQLPVEFMKALYELPNILEAEEGE